MLLYLLYFREGMQDIRLRDLGELLNKDSFSGYALISGEACLVGD